MSCKDDAEAYFCHPQKAAGRQISVYATILSTCKELLPSTDIHDRLKHKIEKFWVRRLQNMYCCTTQMPLLNT